MPPHLSWRHRRSMRVLGENPTHVPRVLPRPCPPRRAAPAPVLTLILSMPASMRSCSTSFRACAMLLVVDIVCHRLRAPAHENAARQGGGRGGLAPGTKLPRRRAASPAGLCSVSSPTATRRGLPRALHRRHQLNVSWLCFKFSFPLNSTLGALSSGFFYLFKKKNPNQKLAHERGNMKLFLQKALPDAFDRPAGKANRRLPARAARREPGRGKGNRGRGPRATVTAHSSCLFALACYPRAAPLPSSRPGSCVGIFSTQPGSTRQGKTLHGLRPTLFIHHFANRCP